MQIHGIGTEIVDCLRIAQLIERHGELFVGRVYTPHEIDFCAARHAATQHYAGHWAAKEAVLKALGTSWRRGIRWKEIEVRSQRNGLPSVALHGAARDVVARAGIQRIHLSIAHCRTHATAYAVAEGD